MVFPNMVLLNQLPFIYSVSDFYDGFYVCYYESLIRLNLIDSIRTTDAAAGADLSSISGDDSIELTRAKQLITEYLTRWASV